MPSLRISFLEPTSATCSTLALECIIRMTTAMCARQTSFEGRKVLIDHHLHLSHKQVVLSFNNISDPCFSYLDI